MNAALGRQQVFGLRGLERGWGKGVWGGKAEIRLKLRASRGFDVGEEGEGGVLGDRWERCDLA